MAVKIRLARRGRAGRPFYSIVAADSRAPRDGRYIEKLGTFDPMTDPSTVELDFDKAFDWVMKGAQPTDTARSILSGQGVMLKKHLAEGVRKGALTEEQAEAKLQSWLKEKEAKVQGQIDSITKAKSDAVTKQLEIEKQQNEARAAEIAKRKAEAQAEAADNAQAETEAQAEEAAEAAAETPEAPEASKEASEEPKAEE